MNEIQCVKKGICGCEKCHIRRRNMGKYFACIYETDCICKECHAKKENCICSQCDAIEKSNKLASSLFNDKSHRDRFHQDYTNLPDAPCVYITEDEYRHQHINLKDELEKFKEKIGDQDE